MTTDRDRFWHRVLKGSPNACWPFVGAHTSDGYGQMQWDGKVRLAHRIAYQLATGTSLAYEDKLHPGSICVLHVCDNPSCCNPSHLKLGTQRDNIRDASAKRRLLSGDANPSRRLPERLARGDANGSRKHPEKRPRGSAQKAAKLRDADIPVIRKRLHDGEAQTAIARDYGVSQNMIWRICHGKAWIHL